MRRPDFPVFLSAFTNPAGTRADATARAVAVQPKWAPRDFVTPARFRAWMRAQLEQARPHLAPDRPNLVVLTELNGLPLLLMGAHLASRAPSFQAALALTLVKHLPAVLYTAARKRVSLPRALQLTLAAPTARVYLSVCRDLAREYGVFLACGTAPLPHFRRESGNLVPNGTGVYNQAVLLNLNGELIGTADKVYLTEPECEGGLDLTPGRLADLRVYPTPVGDLAVATSLDAFKSDVIRHVSAHGATVLLQPDANGAEWTGKEQESPAMLADVDPGDPPAGGDGRHEPRDQPVAWLESAWLAVRSSSTIRYVVNPMVVGNLFDVPFDGQSAITAADHEAPGERSYVMTSPRPGFLALLPWVTDGDADTVRRVGKELAPRSGHARENQYVTGVISADLRLPPCARSSPPHRPHEAALNDYLTGNATLKTQPVIRTLEAAWPALAAGLTTAGLAALRRGRVKRGLALTVVGGVLTALTLA